MAYCKALRRWHAVTKSSAICGHHRSVHALLGRGDGVTSSYGSVRIDMGAQIDDQVAQVSVAEVQRQQQALTGGTPNPIPDLLADAEEYLVAASQLDQQYLLKEAVALLEQIQRSGFEADVVAYGAALRSCERGSQRQPVMQLLHDMRSHVTHLALCTAADVGACEGALCDWERALFLLPTMDKQCSPQQTAASYAGAISACAKGKRWSEACCLLADMRRRVLEPTLPLYGAVVRACRAARTWQAAVRLLTDMYTHKVEPDVVTYDDVVDTCALGHHWGVAMHLLSNMCEVGPSPSPRTHALIGCLPWSTPSQELYACVPRPCAVIPQQADVHGSNPKLVHVNNQPSDQDLSQRADAMGVNLRSQSGSTAEPKLAQPSQGEADCGAVDPSAAENEPLSYRPLPNGDAIIDLHGLPVEVSKIAVQVALEDLLLGGGPGTRPSRNPHTLGDLIIVTGVGRNSPGGVALVRPAIIAFLREQLRIAVLETRRDGPGRLRVPASELRRLRGVPAPR